MKAFKVKFSKANASNIAIGAWKIQYIRTDIIKKNILKLVHGANFIYNTQIL